MKLDRKDVGGKFIRKNAEQYYIYSYEDDKSMITYLYRDDGKEVDINYFMDFEVM